MTAPLSPLPSLSDELLSAYLDGQVTAAESARVEQARAQDDGVALRLHMLEQTVDLLKEAPRLAVPRSFVLSEAQVLAAGGHVKGARAATRAGGFWAWLGGLSPQIMPLATAAVAVTLLLVVGIDWTGSRAPAAAPAPQAAMAPEARTMPGEMEMSAQPPANEEAPAAAAEAELAVQSMTLEAAPSPEATLAAAKSEMPEDSARLQAETADETAALKSVISEEAPAPASSLRLLELALLGLLIVMLALTLLGRRARLASPHG